MKRLTLVLMFVLGASLCLGGPRLQKIEDPGEPGPLPPCEADSICAHGPGQCVTDNSGTGWGCCGDGRTPPTCETIPPRARAMFEAGVATEELPVFGGKVYGYRMVRYIETADFIAEEDLLESGGAWIQRGLFVMRVYGRPRLYSEAGALIRRGGWLNDLGSRWEYVPPENLQPRVFDEVKR